MQEAFGNLLEADVDVVVITTNGFYKRDGNAVMGKGIAKAIQEYFPCTAILGTLLKTKGNHVHLLGYINNITIVSYPVKPNFEVFTGTNSVRHMKNKFKIGDSVPGWACKANPELIKRSAYELVELVNEHQEWKLIGIPRPGCGAGELDWETVKPILDSILDDRFIAYTF